MATNEERIWNFLKDKGLNDCGIAGLMGNLQAESGLRPDNLQNTFAFKLKMSDSEYTKAVDNGTYTKFSNDSAGYGLAQWTWWTRKRNLYNYAKQTKKSIGDLEMQLEFLFEELSKDYKSVLKVLMNAKTVLEASNAVLFYYEAPADQGTAVQATRALYAQKFYNKYAAVGTFRLTDDCYTFWAVSRKFGCTVAEIQKLNPALSPHKLKIGQVINVPAK